MYAAAHRAPDSVTVLGLQVSTCNPPGIAVPVSDSLGIPFMRFRSLLESAVSTQSTSAGRDSSVSILSEAIMSSTRHRVCTAEIVARSVSLANFNWRAPRERGTPVLRWTVSAPKER
jgi:hypothetical protein